MAVGAVTAVLALLALTAMHALPMGMGHSDAVAGDATAGSVGTPASGLMHAGHVDGMVMSGVLATANTAAGTVPAVPAITAGAKHSTGGVPPHGHSLLHLCVAVLVVGLSLALAAGLRRRLWGSVLLTRMVPVRAALTRDTGPPSLAGLCLLRC